MNEAETHQVKLLDYELPPLRDGLYTLTITQTVKSPDSKTLADGKHPAETSERSFVIRGPQFTLSPDEVVAVYPPRGAVDDYRQVMPHVILKRTTLPWERSSGNGSNSGTSPWLGLILINEKEINEKKVDSQTVTLNNLSQDPKAYFPLKLDTESGNEGDKRVQVLDIDSEFGEELLPKWFELRKLAHVRLDGSASRAVVVAHPRRRSIPPGRTIVHLVSLEEWYQDERLRGVDSKKRRFITLFNWSFVCEEKPGRRSFEALSEKLSVDTLQMPGPGGEEHLEYLRQQGAVALNHLRRSGNATAAIYHGPLVPWAGANNERSTDDLKLEPTRTKVFSIEDVSYSAARELGRLMLLHDPAGSRQLYNWESHLAQLWSSGGTAPDHLPFTSQMEPYQLPQAWFERLMRLEGVPFAYLVPDERMLPRESLRFFEVEQRWLQALVDGALSLVWVAEGDSLTSRLLRRLKEQRRELHDRIPGLSGFLLRSALVSDWPELHVSVKPASSEITVRRLSRDVALYLFGENPTEVTLSVPAGLLHFEWNDKIDCSKMTSSDLAAACLAKLHSLQLEIQ